MANRVLKKIVFCVTAKLSSPLCISNGEGILTDQDVIRDHDGNPFIPGSSLTGAMRGYLGAAGDNKCIFGYADSGQDSGEMSSVFVSDLIFTSRVVSRVRDGVALSEYKTARTGAKYDMEVIETGAEGYFFMELVIRERDRETKMLEQIRQVFNGWSRHEIRLGAKKTRGYGKLDVLSVRSQVYSGANILKYADAYRITDGHSELPDVTQEWMETSGKEGIRYLTIEVPLRLAGGISIRQYAVKKGEPDFVHITIGEGKSRKAVIPGTSFAGAIRHRMAEILSELGEKPEDSQKLLDEIWGYVRAGADDREEREESVKRQSEARRSAIVIDECILENARPLTMVRNGISRFEASARDGALFKERSYVGGTTTLMIRIKKQDQEEERRILDILLPVLQDIRNGYLPVGGQTAVGRGIFCGNGRIRVDGRELEGEYA